MASKIIDSSDQGIVVKETMVQLSDEKLKGILLRTYERAKEDMSAFKFYKYYGVFLSVGGTLFLSLLTSKFGSIGTISAGIVTKIAWCMCVGSVILGFVLMGINVSDKMKNDASERDRAVDEIFEQHLKNN